MLKLTVNFPGKYAFHFLLHLPTWKGRHRILQKPHQLLKRDLLGGTLRTEN